MDPAPDSGRDRAPDIDPRPRWVRVTDAISVFVKPVFVGAAVSLVVLVYIGIALLCAFAVTLFLAWTALLFVPSAWYWTVTLAVFILAFVGLLASPKIIGKILHARG